MNAIEYPSTCDTGLKMPVREHPADEPQPVLNVPGTNFSKRRSCADGPLCRQEDRSDWRKPDGYQLTTPKPQNPIAATKHKIITRFIMHKLIQACAVRSQTTLVVRWQLACYAQRQ